MMEQDVFSEILKLWADLVEMKLLDVRNIYFQLNVDKNSSYRLECTVFYYFGESEADYTNFTVNVYKWEDMTFENLKSKVIEKAKEIKLELDENIRELQEKE